MSGPYLWQVAVPRWNSAIGLVLFAAFGSILLGILAAHRGAMEARLATVFLWLFALAAVWGAYVFGRWVLSPPLALAATETGLLTFLQVDKADYGLPGFLVPWSEIDSVSYETYVTSNRVRRHALAVHLRVGHSPIPVDRISLQREPDVLYWNVWSAAIGTRVVSDLEPLLQRFGSPRH